MAQDKRFWLGFNLVRGIGAVRLRSLIEYFGSAEDAWKGTPEELRTAGLGPKTVARLVAVRNDVDLDRLWDRVQSQGIRLLTSEDEAYPARLKEIEQPPPVLFVRGDWTTGDELAVAIVGTRRITAYGRQVTEQLAGHLAANGITIVSGLARGIDEVAHSAALAAGGRTAAVLGSGVDRVYPPENRALAEKIIGSGALLSDYPMGTAPESSNFPPRNRIISGLSRAVIVVEAGETSGALITAEFAAEQGRDVFAVPGSILAPQSRGTNKLIQNGALPLLHPDDVLQGLNLGRAGEQRAARKILPTDEVEANVLGVLGSEPLHVDEICNSTALPVEKVSAALVMMELKGMVRQVGGMQYVAVREVQSGYSA
ncbi:MAG TPA: DNA-processing protein DprA [Anaerolineales bacterium]